MIPDDGIFIVYEPLDPSLLHVARTAHFRICGVKHMLLITALELDDIHNAGFPMLAIGLSKLGRSWTYGPR